MAFATTDLTREQYLEKPLPSSADSERVIEQFALRKPAMRIVVKSVPALGSVVYSTDLFPAMTLGPGTLGGSITSDNISPLHLLNIKRVAFETRPVGETPVAPTTPQRSAPPPTNGAHSWMDEIEARLRARAGNPAAPRTAMAATKTAAAPADAKASNEALPLPERDIEALIRRYRR